MKTKLIFLLFATAIHYATSAPAAEEPEWVKEMLQMESSNGNGIQSLKAPIIPESSGSEMASANKGRSAPTFNRKAEAPLMKSASTKKESLDTAFDLDSHEKDANIIGYHALKQDDVALDEGSDSAEPGTGVIQQEISEEPKAKRKFGERRFGQTLPFNNNDDRNSDTSIMVEDDIFDSLKATQRGGPRPDHESDEEEELMIPQSHQRMMERFQRTSKKLPYFQPAPVNPIVQLKSTNMLVKRDNQQQVNINAYQRLAELNERILMRINKASS